MNLIKVNEVITGLVRVAALVADADELLQVFLRHSVEGESRDLDLLEVLVLVPALQEA